MILTVDNRRKPAWTDRVLHMANPSLQMQQIAYRGHPEITLSDHRPVSAEFLIQVSTDIHLRFCVVFGLLLLIY